MTLQISQAKMQEEVMVMMKCLEMNQRKKVHFVQERQ